MIRYLPSTLVAALLATSALAGSPPPQQPQQGKPTTSLQQAAEEYISTKLDCDNMSQYRKDTCLRDAEEKYRQAKQAASAV